MTKWILRFRLEVALGYIAYGLALIVRRVILEIYGILVALYLGAKFRWSSVKLPQKPPEPTRTVDFAGYYRMGLLEIVLGKDPYSRQIRIDLRRPHTIVAGGTGSGKSIILNSMLLQLFSKGAEFTSQYDVYLIDLKGDHEGDYFDKWKPLCKGYFDAVDNPNIEDAIKLLSSFADRMYRTRNDKSSKGIVLFIDEVSFLTEKAPDTGLRRHAERVLNIIASQLRGRGALVVTTQRPHFQSLPRAITVNLERKICLRVDDKDSAKLILKRYPTLIDPRTMRDGDFILSEPQKHRLEVIGRSIMPDLPGEIDIVVGRNIEYSAENDDRLKILRASVEGMWTGEKLKGINRVHQATGATAEDIKLHRRNYVEAGIAQAKLDKNKNVDSYILTVSPEEAVMMVKRHIEAGNWRSAPEKVNGGRQEPDGHGASRTNSYV